MLIVSGYKVYSVHVEDILIKHPAIELVAIVGLKDPKRPGSEIVKAVVQLKEGIQPTDEVKEDIRKYAAAKLSKYENPKI
ncbi:MAG: AMP-binding enzyme [Candidatus Helarchaeota archaeon]